MFAAIIAFLLNHPVEALGIVSAAYYFVDRSIDTIWRRHDSRREKVAGVARAVWDAAESWGHARSLNGPEKTSYAWSFVEKAAKAAGVKLTDAEFEVVRGLLDLFSAQAAHKTK